MISLPAAIAASLVWVNLFGIGMQAGIGDRLTHGGGHQEARVARLSVKLNSR